MVDNAQANWNAAKKIYGEGAPSLPMVGRERTCLFHWSQSLDKVTQKYIKTSLQFQHKQLCKNYIYTKTIDEVETKYHVIRLWWLSSGVAIEEGILDLSEWLGFLHFCYRQWSGHMIIISASSLCVSDIISLSKIHDVYLHISSIKIGVIFSQDMTMDEHAELPKCNLAETMHNEWLQQSENKMICMYEATVDDLIRAFIQIANYKSWLRRGSTSKGPDFASLKMKVDARCGYSKLLANVMKSYSGLEDLNTEDCALEGSEFFGSTKTKA